MKRRNKSRKRDYKKTARYNTKRAESLSYDALEKRQVLVADIGFSAIGATLGEAGITSRLSNAEGDVSTDHFVEVGQQTFTVYRRDGGDDATVIESQSLNQFFIDAGAEQNLFGEDLQAPRVIFDRAIDRWFVIATGDGDGNFAGNRIHIAFSQSADPSGQWQQLDFVADFSGQLLHTNATLGVDADAVYFSTQNLDSEGELVDISIYSIPKSDLFQANPTIADITIHDNLSIFDYGETVQFASNFEASDGSIQAFSTSTVDLNAGTGLPPNPRLMPGVLNAFRITGADGPDSILTDSVDVVVDPEDMFLGPFSEPLPFFQPSEDGQTPLELIQPSGLNAGLIEADGRLFGAQTVGFDAAMLDVRNNGINWFELDVSGDVPVTLQTEIILDQTFFVDAGGNVDFVPDANNTPEQGAVNYFNPAIGISESGFVALTFNVGLNFEAANFDIFAPGGDTFDFFVPAADGTFDLAASRIGTVAAVGLRVQEGAIQLEAPQIFQRSPADGPFDQSPAADNLWGRYSSVRPDPARPNSLFSVTTFQDTGSPDRWSVFVAEIQPVELTPLVSGTPDGDLIVVSLDPADSDFIEVRFDGVLVDRYESPLIDQIIIDGMGGNDTFIVDHIFGDPTPSGGFVFFGSEGASDTLEIRTDEQVDFQINDQNDGAPTSTFTLVTENGEPLPAAERIVNTFTTFEGLTGGSNDDSFSFNVGVLAGDVNGNAGNDRFIFEGGVRTNGSVNGGSGFNTLDLTNRTEPTEIVLFSTGLNEGFNGRTLNGPIGDFGSILDQFRDISLVRGSVLEIGDSVTALNQFEANYTLQITDIAPFVSTPDTAASFVATSLEQDGEKLYLTDFEIYVGSVIDDTFNVRSNDGLALPFVQLLGREGEDTFNFSSDSPTNNGVLADIGGVFEIDGGTGSSSLVVSDEGRLGPDEFLVLGERISGPVEIIFMGEDTYDVTIIGSDGVEPDTFFLQSFLPENTLNVFGMGGDDIFVIQDLSQAVVELFGGEGNDDYIIEQVNGVDDRNVTITDSVGTELDQAILAGTVLDEVFIVDIDSFASEQFDFIGVEEFGFDGRGGDDEFYVRAIEEEFPVILRGGDGDDTFYVSSDAPVNLGNLADLNNNLTIEDEVGSNRIEISNESGDAIDVEVLEDQITGLFNGVLNYSGIFSLIDIVGSNGGNDRFVVTSFLAGNSLQIDGRLGEDEFIIGETLEANINGDVLVDGGSDGDTYTVFLANLQSENVTIQDTGFSGIDILNAIGSEADDNITLTEFSITAGLQAIQINEFFEQIIITGLEGEDSITMMNAPADVILDGGADADTIVVTGTVGVDELDVIGGDGDDNISITGSSPLTQIDVYGGVGDDTLNVGSGVLGDIELIGGLGSDQFVVVFAGIGSRTVTVNDASNDEDTNTLEANGTLSADEFGIVNDNVTLGSESIVTGGLIDLINVFGLDGSDIFNVINASVDLVLGGGQDNDVFNFGSEAPMLTSGNSNGITGNVTVNGGEGLNQLNITDFSGAPGEITVTTETISGLTANPITYTGRFDQTGVDSAGIQIVGSNNGRDTFNIDSLKAGDSIRAYGLFGQDIFNIGAGIAGNAFFDGGDNSDTYNIQFGAAAQRDIVIEDSGPTGTDNLNLSGSDGDDNIVLTTTSVSDEFTTLSFNIPLNEIEIAGGLGNDSFTINGALNDRVSLFGDEGTDTFTVNSTDGIDDLNLFGGIDADTFVFNGSSGTTRIDADGFEGSDTYTVGIGVLGNLFLDGQNGSDNYNVQLGASGTRRIDTRDTGDNGQDVTTVTGTTQNDRVAIRTTRFLYNEEIVIFDENTERVAVNAGNGNDRIVVFGSRSPLTEAFAGAGNDTFVVNGGSAADVINLQGQTGNDTFNVFRTSAGTTNNLFGNENNDRFNIGSTLNADNGNLGLIRGELNIFGGSNDAGQEDQLVVNDSAGGAAYSYSVTPSRIAPIPGPFNLPRTNFVGVNYDTSTEFVRLDGTVFANLFEVVASPVTRFFIDGNAPNSNVGDRIVLQSQPGDGGRLTITSANAGNGFYSFDNGNELVQFTNIELQSIEDSGTGNFTLPPDFDLGGDLDEFFSRLDADEFEDFGFPV